MKPKYAGPQSNDFWAYINNIEPEEMCNVVYIAACALQDHESRVLQMISYLQENIVSKE